MGWVQWLVYIISFFLPPFGFITFWAFSGREPGLSDVGKNSLIASFIGIIVMIILAAVGVTMFNIPWGMPGD